MIYSNRLVLTLEPDTSEVLEGVHRPFVVAMNNAGPDGAVVIQWALDESGADFTTYVSGKGGSFVEPDERIFYPCGACAKIKVTNNSTYPQTMYITDL